MNEVDGLLGLSDVHLWYLLVGFFLPLVVSFLKQPGWSKKTTTLVTFLVFIVVGAVTVYLLGAFTGRTVVSSILIVAAISLVFYQGFWKPTGVDEKVMVATSPRGH